MASSSRASSATASSSRSSLRTHSSSRPSSSSKRSLYGCNSASTSMSSLESSANPEKRCNCELVDEAKLKKLYLDHAESTDGLWNGPMPVAEWKERFMPSAEASSSKIDFSAAPETPDAPSFVNCLNDSAICATVFPRATHAVHGTDHSTGNLLSPDFSVLSHELDMDHDSRRLRDELFSATLAFGEITSEDHDPCPFACGKPDTKEAAYTRGRLAAIMRAVAVNSHRTFCYAFVIMPEHARLLRFDHGGITFTELFSWRTTGDLADFLARFDNMTAADRGLDTSVTTIISTSQEARQARKILAKSDALPEGVAKTSVIPKNHRGTLSLMQVYDDEEKTFHRVVVHRAVKSVDRYLGRSTRGFYGVDLEEQAVVYVKDAWRILSNNAAPEAATYRRLNAHHVPHLPGFYHGGDVPMDTPALLLSPSASPTTIPTQSTTPYDAAATAYTHHRLLLKNIGRPLKTFQSTHQLCTALLHALEGHSAAYQDGKVLHRDISGGNVLIDKNGRGMLIDWDMCVWCENTEEMTKIGQPVGTWPFISAELLMADNLRPHLLRDDLESFVHVLFYYVLRYRPMYPEGSEGRSVLVDDLNAVFDGGRWREHSGRVAGGKTKAVFLTGCVYFDNAEIREHVRPIPLLRLLENVRDAFKPLYTVKPSTFMYQPEDEEYAELMEELEEHQAAYTDALEQLQSPDHMLSMFRYWTGDAARDGLQWLPDDSADDLYAPRPPTSSCTTKSRSSRKRSIAVRNCPTPVSKVPRNRLLRDQSAGAVARARTSGEP